jgi:phosphohistidine phosphatase SixA
MGSARSVWWTLRVGAALCFIGHGAFGIITKEAWLPFFGLVGIGREAALDLMPVVGTVDIIMGLTVLITPRPAALLYMVAWALWTAALRPLTGDSVFEMLERAGNYGVPLAMLIMCRPAAGWRSWFAPSAPRPMTPGLQATLRLVLATTTALLLVGHGALGIRSTPSLTAHYASLGMSTGAVTATMPVVGWLELALVVLVVLRPAVATALVLAAWKLATESLWLVAGAPFWEFVERAGSYAAPLALALVMSMKRRDVGASSEASSLPAMRRLAAMVVLGLAASLVAPSSAIAQGRDSLAWRTRIRQLDDASLLAALRRGGLVLACRHAMTPDGVSDRSETDRALQRNLSEEGRQQAMAIGRAVRGVRVGVCPILSSPMFRTRETASLAFGDTAVTVTPLLRGEPPLSDLMPLFLDDPPDGQNRVLMTHQGTLYRILTMFRRGEIREGDCVVLRPNDQDGTFEVVAKLGLGDWERLAKR